MELVKEVKLNSRDRLILESYKAVLDGLADYLGSGYEIVLHSLENFEHSVIKIINGEHTGRKEGEQEISGKSGNLISMMKLCYTKGKTRKSRERNERRRRTWKRSGNFSR